MIELNLPRQFNAAEYFVDRNINEGRGDKTAILFEDQVISYSLLAENVNRVASVLTDLGVGMEMRVMILLRDSPEMLYSFYGTIKAGAVAIPTNILMKAPDFLYMLNDSRAPVLIVDAVFLPEIEKILNQAVFLKKVVVCGDQDHDHLTFNELVAKAGMDFNNRSMLITLGEQIANREYSVELRQLIETLEWSASLSDNTFVWRKQDDPVGCLELALEAAPAGEAAESKLRSAIKAGNIGGYTESEQLDNAISSGAMTEDDASALRRFWTLRRQCIMVDDFPKDIGRNIVASPHDASVAPLDGTYSG
jgi:hypothetical protein